jgi:pimeloyl-ACP methyl ester carboxylesterase
VRGIAFVATSARGIVSKPYGKAAERIVGSRIASRVMSRRAGYAFARRAFGRRAQASHVSVTRRSFAGTDRAATRALLAAMHAMDLRALDALGCGTVVIAGGADRLTPPARGEEIARRLGAELIVVPDVGHMIPLEAPDVVVDAIDKLVAQV